MGKARKNARNRKLKFKFKNHYLKSALHCSATSAGIDIAQPFTEKEKSCSKTLI